MRNGMMDDTYFKSLKYTRSETVTFLTPILRQNIVTDKVELDIYGHLTIYRGFQYDGPTFLPDLKTLMKESAVHDAFYYLMKGDWLSREFQELVDDHFYVSIIKDDKYSSGIPRWRAKIYRKALKLFGHRALKGDTYNSMRN